MSGIIVGIDGSGHAQPALEWAMTEAAVRHCALTVLTVNPIVASYWTGNPVAVPGDAARQEKDRLAAEEAVAAAAGRLGGQQPASVTVQAVSGFPAQELIEASKTADLLVVGARGGGGLGRMALGSIASAAVHHSACPVVVVPHAER